jgi:hypothetical protein
VVLSIQENLLLVVKQSGFLFVFSLLIMCLKLLENLQLGLSSAQLLSAFFSALLLACLEG